MDDVRLASRQYEVAARAFPLRAVAGRVAGSLPLRTTTRSAGETPASWQKEQSWRTAWRARSLLSRTIGDSAPSKIIPPTGATASRHMEKRSDSWARRSLQAEAAARHRVLPAARTGRKRYLLDPKPGHCCPPPPGRAQHSADDVERRLTETRRIQSGLPPEASGWTVASYSDERRQAPRRAVRMY